jgi:hypothetical protein
VVSALARDGRKLNAHMNISGPVRLVQQLHPAKLNSVHFELQSGTPTDYLVLYSISRNTINASSAKVSVGT